VNEPRTICDGKSVPVSALIESDIVKMAKILIARKHHPPSASQGYLLLHALKLGKEKK
jgi:hypothetical protein